MYVMVQREERRKERRMGDWSEVSRGEGVTVNRLQLKLLLPLNPRMDKMPSHGIDIYALLLRMVFESNRN